MKIVTGTAQADIPTPYRNLRELLDFSVERYPEIPAYIFNAKDQNEEITVQKSYVELRQDINDFALGVAELLQLEFGHSEPSHIAIIGNNSYPWVVCHNAVLFGLGVSVPLDKELPTNEVLRLCNRAQVSAFAFDYSHRDSALALARDDQRVKVFVLLDKPEKKDQIEGRLKQLNSKARIFTFAETIAHGKTVDQHKKDEFRAIELPLEEMAVLSFTSGTTAESKGVMLSHLNIISNVRQGAKTIAYDAGMKALSVLPLHHSFEATVGMWCMWALGITVCINDSLRTLLPNMQKWKVDAMLTVPLMLTAIYRRVKRAIESSGKMKSLKLGLWLSRLLMKLGIDKRRTIFRSIHENFGGSLKTIISGAAALPPNIQQLFNDVGIDCLTGYGLTEASPVLAVTRINFNVVGSVGLPLSDVTLAIEGPADSRENAGEILARGDNIMLGYYQDEESTKATFTEDGWLKTGDVGYFDENDCLYITGRAKSCIVLANGKNVFPEEIEDIFMKYPGVKNIIIWGESSARGAIDLAARFEIDIADLPSEVNPESKSEITKYLQEIVSEVNDQMIQYKRVKWFIWDESELITNTTMKVKRDDEIAKIRAALAQKNTDMHELKADYFSL